MNFFALNSNRKLFDKTIVVSNYWKLKLVSMGFSNVSVVYNSFNPSDFVITNEEKIQFKKKYFPPEHMLVAWKLIDVVYSSAELPSTQELFQALLVELSEG